MNDPMEVRHYTLLERIAGNPKTARQLNSVGMSAIARLRSNGLIMRVGLEDYLTPEGKRVLSLWEVAHEAPASMQRRAQLLMPSHTHRDVKLKLATRFRILQRDNFRCQYCGRSPATDLGVRLEVDHKRSIAHGGTNSDDNLVTACFDCNNGKGSRSV